MAKSTYHYYIQKFSLPDKYQEEKKMICQIFHENHGRYGYRRITLGLNQRGYNLNHKTVLKLMNQCDLKCMVRRKKYNTYRGTVGKVAPNILERDFSTTALNQKWVTDISEFKYGVGEDDKKGKLYLSIILDLCDRRPVAFVYSTRNDNPLVFDTFDKAVAANPGATPLLHSDRGYQYTSKAFRRRILAAGMTQSMSRVARCIDNGPMEGFC